MTNPGDMLLITYLLGNRLLNQYLIVCSNISIRLYIYILFLYMWIITQQNIYSRFSSNPEAVVELQGILYTLVCCLSPLDQRDALYVFTLYCL